MQPTYRFVLLYAINILFGHYSIVILRLRIIDNWGMKQMNNIPYNEQENQRSPMGRRRALADPKTITKTNSE